jgi:hypothetical protein
MNFVCSLGQSCAAATILQINNLRPTDIPKFQFEMFSSQIRTGLNVKEIL